MKKNIIFISLGFLISCTLQSNSGNQLNNNHHHSQIDIQRKFKNFNQTYVNNGQPKYIANRFIEYDLVVLLKEMNDTIFFDYMLVSQDFINSNHDSTVFAGYFLEEDVIENEVKFYIQNFNDNSFPDIPYPYSLKLKFSDNMDTIYWEMLERAARLPQRDTLIKTHEIFYE